MDTETFLLRRDSLALRLDDRRRAVAFAQQRAASLIPGISMPFWLRFGVAAVLPRLGGGLWLKGLAALVPLVIPMISPKPRFQLIPLVKSLINRYNPRS